MLKAVLKILKRLVVTLAVVMLLSGCSLPSVSAESRIFLPLSLEYLSALSLPTQDATGHSLGQLTDLTYDRGRDRIYALLDTPQTPSVVTLNLDLTTADPSSVQLDAITPVSVTPLHVPASNPDTPTDALTDVATADEPTQNEPTQDEPTKSVGLTLRGQTLWVTRQTQASTPSPITAFGLPSGEAQAILPLPKRLLPHPEATDPEETTFPAETGLKAITLDPEGQRLFTATEQPFAAALAEPPDTSIPYSRFFHYWIGDPQPYLLAEHLYPLTPSAPPSRLTALMTLDGGGHFLSLEQWRDAQGTAHGQIFQLATGDATDVSAFDPVPLDAVVPIRKHLLLDLSAATLPEIGSELTGMTFGPYLPDGSRSLLLISRNATAPPQLLLLRLHAR